MSFSKKSSFLAFLLLITPSFSYAASQGDACTQANPIKKGIGTNAPEATLDINGEIKHVRTLIEKIFLTPKANQEDLSIDLYGDLAGILKIATKDKTMKDGHHIDRLLKPLVANDNNEKSVKLVAGAGFEPTTFGL